MADYNYTPEALARKLMMHLLFIQDLHFLYLTMAKMLYIAL